MNQPDSIQKSRPGLRREVLPGSRLCLGFRSPRRPMGDEPGAGGVPGGPPRADCVGGRASLVRAARAGRGVRGPACGARPAGPRSAPGLGCRATVPEVTGREMESQDCRDQNPFRLMLTAKRPTPKRLGHLRSKREKGGVWTEEGSARGLIHPSTPLVFTALQGLDFRENQCLPSVKTTYCRLNLIGGGLRSH